MKQWQLKQIVNDAHNNKPHVGVITAQVFDVRRVTLVPLMLMNYLRIVVEMVEEHKTFFGIVPGKTTLDCHYIQQRVHLFVYPLDAFQVTIIRKLSSRLS